MNKILPTDTFIGIDHGEENTGIALGRNSLVTPLEVISSKSDGTLIHTIIKLGMENKVAGYVTGLPLTVDGKETKQSIRIRQFAKLLRVMSKKPVFFQDEHGTSREAIREAMGTGISPSRRKSNDHLSAALILRRFFSEQAESSKQA